DDGTVVEDVSLARGNIVLADHGRTVSEEFVIDTPLPTDHPVRLRLGHQPLTMHCLAGVRPEDVQYHPVTGRVISERTDRGCDVREAQPAVWLQVTTTANVVERWTAVPDLLSSGDFDQHYVVDVESDGRATLRFGDGEYGRRLTAATRILAWYRVGNER